MRTKLNRFLIASLAMTTYGVMMTPLKAQEPTRTFANDGHVAVGAVIPETPTTSGGGCPLCDKQAAEIAAQAAKIQYLEKKIALLEEWKAQAIPLIGLLLAPVNRIDQALQQLEAKPK